MEGDNEEQAQSVASPEAVQVQTETDPLIEQKPEGQPPDMQQQQSQEYPPPQDPQTTVPVDPQGGYPPAQGGYPPAEGGTPPAQGEYPPPQGGAPPAQGGYPPPQGGAPPAQGGYPPPQGGAPPAQSGYPPPQGGAPPAQGGYPPAQGGYPPPQGGAPPAQGGAPPAQGGYPPAQGGAPPAQGGYPPAQGGAPPAQGGYPPAQGGAPPAQGGYPPAQGGAPPAQGGYPPAQQQQQAEAAPAWEPGAAGSFKWDGQDDKTSDVPTEAFSSFGGYENFGAAIPPPPYEPPPVEQKPEEVYTVPGSLTEEEVRDAMLEFVSENCCYGSSPAKEMEFTSNTPSNALHYKLETFTEGRTTRRHHEPFQGGFVDGPQCGMAPGPWDLPCAATTMFDNHTKYIEVPHTAEVKICFRCTGRGYLRCHTCGGDGQNRCSTCSGSGTCTVTRDDEEVDESCSRCGGDGQTRCHTCGGDGRITCHECKGFRSLRHFLQLVITFTNNEKDFILEETDMPDELIRDVSGQVIFEQTLPYVWPISCYPMQVINDNSIAIVNEHHASWLDQRKLQQRQVLRSVPVSEVSYTWKDTDTRFWVYGFEHKVHSPDYPQQCCWGCNVL